MLQPLNKIETWLRETYITLASGPDLDRISNFYGWRRPQFVSEASWKKALNTALFSARGTAGPIFRFLEDVFDDWSQLTTYDAVALSPNIIQFSGASCVHEGRYCRINGNLYRTARLRGSAFPNDMVLHSIDTMLFKGASFTPNDTFKVKILPFDIEEHGCEYKILLDDGVLNFPKYFIPTNVAEDRDEDIPKSGHIMDFFSDVASERYGNQLEGAYPIYLSADEFGSLFFDALDLMLSAGVHERLIITKWCPDHVSLYGSIFDKKVYGSVTATIPSLVQPTRSS